MPLREIQFPHDPSSLPGGGERFLIFFSSRLPEDNSLWCPDCRDVEDLVNNTFSPDQGPSAVLVYVGQRSEWKTADNVYRKEPWKVTSIPTIVKLNEEGKEVGRLVDKMISEQLPSFVQ